MFKAMKLFLKYNTGVVVCLDDAMIISEASSHAFSYEKFTIKNTCEKLASIEMKASYSA